jgi:hypothetical protein
VPGWELEHEESRRLGVPLVLVLSARLSRTNEIGPFLRNHQHRGLGIA